MKEEDLKIRLEISTFLCSNLLMTNQQQKKIKINKTL